jgi:hypothetical protein
VYGGLQSLLGRATVPALFAGKGGVEVGRAVVVVVAAGALATGVADGLEGDSPAAAAGTGLGSSDGETLALTLGMLDGADGVPPAATPEPCRANTNAVKDMPAAAAAARMTSRRRPRLGGAIEKGAFAATEMLETCVGE